MLWLSLLTFFSYGTAINIIGDPDKKNPQTRQSADHSMLYIIATLLRKANERVESLKHLTLGKFSDVEKVKREKYLAELFIHTSVLGMI